ncbi:hypothetical protein V8G54_026839 [Vigna mungo]|uniref:Mannosyltransferase n=1 Tax=Vigna mungo TaxID=3915 RepID=A0AAQ3N1J1_VIGMU
MWIDPYISDMQAVAKVMRPVALSLILYASHARTFSLIHGYSAPLEVYKILEHYDAENNSVLCVGSEWHRFPSSFFIPDYVGQVRWIDDGFRGLLPFPFNSTLGGTAAAPPYFNNKNMASSEQFLLDVDACTFLVELQLNRPYLTRGSDLSTWEPIAALPYLDRELSPALYRSFFIPYLWQDKNVFGTYKLFWKTSNWSYWAILAQRWMEQNAHIDVAVVGSNHDSDTMLRSEVEPDSTPQNQLVRFEHLIDMLPAEKESSHLHS